MIKPTELRIGNIVKAPHGQFPISEILKYAVSFAPYRETPWTQAPFELLKPIDLTEEWLTKLGFSDKEYKEGFIGIDVGHTDFVLTKPNHESESMTNKHYTFHLRYGGWPRYKAFEYVHDLQNFFWALTGEELKTT